MYIYTYIYGNIFSIYIYMAYVYIYRYIIYGRSRICSCFCKLGGALERELGLLEGGLEVYKAGFELIL